MQDKRNCTQSPQHYQNLSDPFQGKKGYQTEDINGQQIINVSANENLVYPLEILRKKLLQIAKTVDLRVYPESYGQSLCKKIAEKNMLQPNQITIANGSDSIIDIIVRMSIKAGESVVIINPTFSMYEHSIQVREGRIKNLTLTKTEFDLDPDTILTEIKHKEDKLLFLCNPNNPTGKQYQAEKIEKIIREFPGIVALDEAYSGFGKYSFVSRVDEFPNLIVLKTFSKLYGIAGIRIGYSFSSEFLAQRLKTTLPPFNVNSIAIELAKSLLDEEEIIANVRNFIRLERDRVYNELKKIPGITPYPSEANFIMFSSTMISQKELYQEMREKGLLLRDLSKIPLCENCLRVTISTKENNDLFLKSLRNFASQSSY